MISDKPMMFNFFLELDTRHLEYCKGPSKMSHKEFPAVTEPNNNNVCIIEIPSVLVDII